MRSLINLLFLTIIATFMMSCKSNQNFNLKSTSNILVTSESGDKQSEQENILFKDGKASEGTIIKINPQVRKQKIDGIGSSFTESSAFVLAHLPIEKRREVMDKIYGENGANFSLARTHIGACDFSVDGKYSYDDVDGDKNLENFSISVDETGFSKKKYPNLIDEKYDLLPMIKEAIQIKSTQKDSKLGIVASAWTAPKWMKDINDWYIKGTPENNYQGTGGKLKPEYESTYADYLIKYLEAYRKQGIDIWGLTPVNEPHGNNGQWESMNFSPETQNDFIKNYLGPKLHSNNFKNVNLLIYDQNRDGIEEWTNTIFADKETNKFVYGVAVHWYESTFKVYEDVFERVNKKFPQFGIVHTEGCIDDLGKDAPNGIGDPERFKEKDWFMNDSFWWNKNATDWAYTAEWAGESVKDHPIYTPVHRYARNIIVSLNHWVRGWIDWNIVLDEKGGPNHAGNFCGAPIMIDTKSKDIYYTPIFDILSQFSRTIRPGDIAVETATTLAKGIDNDAVHSVATINNSNLLSIQILNTTKDSQNVNVQIGEQFITIKLKPNSLETVQVQL